MLGNEEEKVVEEENSVLFGAKISTKLIFRMWNERHRYVCVVVVVDDAACGGTV